MPPRLPLPILSLRTPFLTTLTPTRPSSTQNPPATSTSNEAKPKDPQSASEPEPEPEPKKKTMAQLDEELRLKMEGLAGDGGAAGLELEDGKAVSMKRGVRENMFRYI